jgi:hypothetical protein
VIVGVHPPLLNSFRRQKAAARAVQPGKSRAF